MEPGHSFNDMLHCVTGSWSPRIGDPTVMGWITVLLYATCAAACYRASALRHRDGAFWFCLFLVTAFLCINKQLDLQTAITAVGRCLARSEGWYGQRRVIQATFIAILLSTGALAAIATLITLRKHLWRIGVAVLGLFALLTFVAVRAVGFHHFDKLLGTNVLGVRFNWMMEISGILLILANALVAIRRAPAHRHPRS